MIRENPNISLKQYRKKTLKIFRVFLFPYIVYLTNAVSFCYASGGMKSWVPALGLIGVGFFIAGSIIGGILGGRWLDEKLDTEPVFLILGLVLGIVVAFLGVYNMIKPIIDYMRKGGKYN